MALSDHQLKRPAHWADLREQWRRCSDERGWVFAADWQQDAVDTLCHAITAGVDLEPAGFRLGAARAATGVSLHETLDDLDALWRVHPDLPIGQLARAFCSGWEQEGGCVRSQIIDPLSDLPARDYLEARLREIYEDVASDYVIAVLRMESNAPSAWQRDLLAAVVGQAVKAAFAAGHSRGRIGPATIGVIQRRDRNPWAGATTVKAIVDSLKPGTTYGLKVRAWVEELPPGYENVIGLLASLTR